MKNKHLQWKSDDVTSNREIFDTDKTIARNFFIGDLPWYKKDLHGWPIETWKSQPIRSFLRIICQNIRKITG